LSTSLSILTVDPFKLLLKKQNTSCIYEYTGPRQAIFSADEDCVYSTRIEYAPVGILPLSPSLSCKPSFNEDGDYFEPKQCMKDNENIEKELVQVKVYNNMYHIYCAGNMYTLGRRNVTCPKRIFKLPLSATFTINNIVYRGSVLNIVYHQTEDPMFIDKVEWHLNPHVDYDTLEEKFNVEWEKNEKAIKKEQDTLIVGNGDNILLWAFVVISIFCFMTLLVILIRRIRKGKTSSSEGEQQQQSSQTTRVEIG
jgi:hypothetical protein